MPCLHVWQSFANQDEKLFHLEVCQREKNLKRKPATNALKTGRLLRNSLAEYIVHQMANKKNFGFLLGLTRATSQYTNMIVPISYALKTVFPYQHTKQILTLQVQAHNFCGRNKKGHRLWENEPPTLGKSVTDFGEMSRRLWGNEPPILGKSVTDFGEMSRRLWENEPPTLGK